MKPIYLCISIYCLLQSLTATPQPPPSDSIAWSYSIDDVVVSARSRTKRMGRDVSSGVINLGVAHNIGSEVGVPCNAGKHNLALEELRLWCSTRKVDTLTFRLHIYSMHQGAVGTRLATPQIDIPIDPKSEVTKVNLRPYGLRVSGEFLLAVECVKISMQPPTEKYDAWRGVWINSSLLARTFTRSGNKAQWERVKIGIGLCVDGIVVGTASESQPSSTANSPDSEL